MRLGVEFLNVLHLIWLADFIQLKLKIIFLNLDQWGPSRIPSWAHSFCNIYQWSSWQNYVPRTKYFTFCRRSEIFTNSDENSLQLALNSLHEWSVNEQLEINKDKTVTFKVGKRKSRKSSHFYRVSEWVSPGSNNQGI